MSNLLKDEINLKAIKKLAVLMKNHHSEFNTDNFLSLVFIQDWPELSLKQRIRHLSTVLHTTLNLSFKDAIELLKCVSTEFDGLFHFVFADYVEVYGVEEFDTSIDALELFTQNSTAEFAIRAFLQAYPEKTKQQMLIWSKSNNHHLRRLASEGIRPKLPWATHIDWIAKNPQWVRPIIENLKADQSRYVQKSVANLLNDFSKTEPDWVLTLANEWLKQNNTNTNWIVKHALRSLLKAGDSHALQLMGYGSVKHIHLTAWCMSKQVKIGEKLTAEFELQANQALGFLRIEYALYFLRSRLMPYRKVFKVAESDYTVNSKAFRLTHNFKPITTRNYLPGLHKIELLINGQVIETAEFELI